MVARAHAEHWAEATRAHVLVVDPLGDRARLCQDLSARGIHVTWVGSTLDGLIEFGRINPNAVVVAPDAHGIPADVFVAKLCERDSAFVIAAVDETGAADAGRLMFAGAGAAVTRPYTAKMIWDVLKRSSRAWDDHARVEFGPIELDARAYTVRIDGERIADLPLKEFELLRTLMRRAPEVLSDESLRASLWGRGDGGPTDNTIAVHAARLRGRLQGVAHVRRIRGRGYSLTLC
ncbi:MAG: winged helix-turn-helix domain-containing protein [Nocardioides sp.]